ncbi:MAG TPA: cytotoxic translational repressor of toxin-antitoxin stability system [bacterium]|mgnify:CR=1 FL=1|nr:cytotoxic translational repressor of toxin-antitoxin stability system [bacterium]
MIIRWHVTVKKSVQKQISRLPARIQERLAFLITEIEWNGPVRGNWPNYSKLGHDLHHCHLKKGKPTYVVIWKEYKKEISVEVIYAGSHEKADY